MSISATSPYCFSSYETDPRIAGRRNKPVVFDVEVRLRTGFYGVYNDSGLVRQVSRFINVSVSAYGVNLILDCRI